MNGGDMRKDMEHLKLLSIFYYVLAGVGALFALIPVVHLVVGLVLAVAGAASGKDEAAPLALVGGFFVVIALFAICFGLGIAALKYYTARSISRRENYVFCLVVAGLACLSFPLGTMLGVFTFVVLLRPSVRALFEPGGLNPAWLEVDSCFHSLAGLHEEERARAVLRLAELSRGRDAFAVSYYAFRPLPSGEILRHRWGCGVLQVAVPGMIAMLDGALAGSAEAVLRAVQGRSPVSSRREDWESWWSAEGRALFAGESAPGKFVPCEPQCQICTAFERRGSAGR